jgi:hypothetical protein
MSILKHANTIDGPGSDEIPIKNALIMVDGGVAMSSHF